MKKLLILVSVIFLLTGCTKTAVKEEINSDENISGYQTLKVKLNVKNKEEDKGEYLVFILPEGEKKTEPGKATQTYTQKLQTNSAGELEIPLRFNFNLESSLNKLEIDNPRLEIIVTTLEDIYMRNPLNEKTYIEFIKNYDENTVDEYPFLSVVETKNIDIVDEYPKGVVSLSFPDATFVIKLEFEEGSTHQSSYVVSIYKPNPDSADGIGIFRNGRIDREFQYWETPFFESDNLASWSGYIIVEDDNNQRVMYEDYPKFVSFDESGKCKDGDIVTIKIKS